MSNVYKNGFVQFDSKDTRVIDGNALAAMHIEAHSSVFRELPDTAAPVELQAFDGPADGDDGIALLTGDSGDGFDALSVTNPAAADTGAMVLDTVSVREECDEMIKQANDAAEAAREAARADAVAIREAAKQEGYEAGLAQAYEECNTALENAQKQMAQELQDIRAQYEQMIQQAEPAMIDVICSLYSKIFGEGLCDVRQVLAYLINRTLLKQEGDERVSIFVSIEDYDSLLERKDELFKHIILPVEPEIKPREELGAGQARIETAYGVLDCGIDTQLFELERTLRLLSMEE